MLKRVRMAAVSLILGSGRRKPFLFFTFFQSCLIMMSYQKQVAYKAVKGSSGRLGRSTWRQYDDHHPPMHLNRQTFIMIELGIIIKVFFSCRARRTKQPRPPAPTHLGQAGRTPVCRFTPSHPLSSVRAYGGCAVCWPRWIPGGEMPAPGGCTGRKAALWLILC